MSRDISSSASTFRALGETERARKLLSEGILVAQNAGDMHARDEMQALLSLMR